jgi:hypothetical protein
MHLPPRHHARAVTAFYLILFSAVLQAVVNLATKRAHDKYAMRLMIGICSALLVTPAPFWPAGTWRDRMRR